MCVVLLQLFYSLSDSYNFSNILVPDIKYFYILHPLARQTALALIVGDMV